MTLIVEDGSIVASATSYVALADVQAFATARGLVLPSDQSVLEAQVMRAMDYVESFADRFKGDQFSPGVQALSWPRTNVYFFAVYDTMFPVNQIPTQLKNAVSQLAYLAGTIDFFPSVTTLAVISKTIGPLKTEFSERLGTSSVPFLPSVDMYMKPLLNNNGGLLQNYRA